MKVRMLKGMTVVTMGGGANVGSVDDVYFDVADFRVGALVLWSASGRSVLPFSAVRGIGADAVTIEHDDKLGRGNGAAGQSALSGLRSLDGLLGTQVISHEGIELGTITDLELDPSDGRVTALDLQKGGFLGIGTTHLSVAGASIRGIGPTMITVEGAPAPLAGTPS